MCLSCFSIRNKLKTLVIKHCESPNKTIEFEWYEERIIMTTDTPKKRAYLTKEQAEKIIKYYLEREDFFIYFSQGV